jgi:hypothetical protein
MKYANANLIFCLFLLMSDVENKISARKSKNEKIID